MHRSKNKNNDEIIIAVDAMGGDHAPDSVIDGVRIAMERLGNIKFILFGDKKKVSKKLGNLLDSKSIELRHTASYISGEEKISTAIRQGRNSSMWQAIEAVKNGEADAVMSGGNTGALMAISKLVLRTLPGIDRPAICATVPTFHKKIIMLDLGANVECNSENLFQFAVIGNAYAQSVLKIDNPSIALLNIGSEEVKGSDSIKTAAQLIKDSDLKLNFHGFVEGNNINEGLVDVVVTDGFTGNVSLKSMEGMAKFYKQYLKSAFSATIWSRLGYLLCKRSLGRTAEYMDPKSHNGAMFLGLNGIVVKSHGSMDGLGVYYAFKVTEDLVRNDINNQILEELIIASDHM